MGWLAPMTWVEWRRRFRYSCDLLGFEIARPAAWVAAVWGRGV